MKKKIVIGQINLSFHKAVAAVYQHVLQYLGYQVEMVQDPHQKMFERQKHDQVDLLISAWLPGSHQKFYNTYKDKTHKFPHIYEPYCIWGVPEYVPQNVVKQISDLNKAQIVNKMDKDINGIGMGAGISRFSIEICKQYELQKNGYHFISNQPQKFYEIVQTKYENKKWFIIPLWYPQYLHHKYKIRPIKDPKGLLRGKDNATPVLLKSSMEKLQPLHIKKLSKIYLGNDNVTEMDYMINKQKKSPYQAALEWIKIHNKSVQNYVNKL